MANFGQFRARLAVSGPYRAVRVNSGLLPTSAGRFRPFPLCFRRIRENSGQFWSFSAVSGQFWSDADQFGEIPAISAIFFRSIPVKFGLSVRFRFSPSTFCVFPRISGYFRPTSVNSRRFGSIPVDCERFRSTMDNFGLLWSISAVSSESGRILSISGKLRSVS